MNEFLFTTNISRNIQLVMNIPTKQLQIIDVETSELESFIIDSSSISQEEIDDAKRLLDYLQIGFGEGVYQRILKNVKFSYIKKNSSMVLIAANDFIKNIILQSYFREISSFVYTNCALAKTIEVTVKSEKKAENHQVKKISTAVVPSKQKTTEVEYLRPNINIDNSKRFDQFICSGTNELAYLSAKQVSEMILDNDYQGVSSFYLFGPIGMGKTHLLQSIVTQVKTIKKDSKIDYISAEDFKDGYIEAVRRNQLYRFKKRFFDLDALLIDDVQFIKSSTGSLEREFSRLLNAFIDSRKWVVISCDRHPSKLSIDERTQMRLSSGLKADIKQSDFKLRLMILKFQLEELYQSYEIPHHLLEYIAQNVFTSIRELESKLRSIICYATALKTKVVREGIVQQFVEELRIVKDISKHSDIIDIVCDYYGIRSNDLLGNSRVKKISRARAAAAYIARNNTAMTLKDIGDMLDRKHSTVMYLISSVEADKAFLVEVNKIKSKI